jgi:uncharacterized protein DUF3592
MKEHKGLKLIKIFFAIFGLIFAVIGLAIFWSNYQFKLKASSTTGTITGYVSYQDSDGDTLYKPEASFVTSQGENINFTSNVGSSFRGKDIGEKVEILYMPDNPQKAKMNTGSEMWFLPGIFTGIGSVFFAVGVGMIVANKKRQQTIEWLKRSGQLIQADFIEVQQGNVTVNNRHSLLVTCQWLNPADQQVYVFKSDNLWYDPSSFIQPGQKIPVYINPNNPKKYFVDLSFLPEKA